jgi:hypothetical protein
VEISCNLINAFLWWPGIANSGVSTKWRSLRKLAPFTGYLCLHPTREPNSWFQLLRAPQFHQKKKNQNKTVAKGMGAAFQMRKASARVTPPPPFHQKPIQVITALPCRWKQYRLGNWSASGQAGGNYCGHISKYGAAIPVHHVNAVTTTAALEKYLSYVFT